MTEQEKHSMALFYQQAIKEREMDNARIRQQLRENRTTFIFGGSNRPQNKQTALSKIDRNNNDIMLFKRKLRELGEQ